MASSSTQDAVNTSQSMGDSSSIDVHAHETNTAAAVAGALPAQSTNTESQVIESQQQEQALQGDPNAAFDSSAEGSSHHNATQQNEAAHASNQLANGETIHALDAAKSAGQSDRVDPNLHIEHGHLSDEHALVDPHSDMSVGSDTEHSRADSVDHGRDALSGNWRLSSVKKPTSFKAVSVTKAFLAKTATAPPSAKAGDKGLSLLASHGLTLS